MADKEKGLIDNIKQKNIMNIEFIIFAFLIISPFIDCITAISKRLNINIPSMSEIIRIIFLLFIGIYFLFKTKTTKLKKFTLVYFGIIGIFSIFSILNLSALHLGNGNLSNIKNIVKIFYFSVVLMIFINIFIDEDFKIKKEQLTKIGLIYGLLIFIPTSFGTYFESYGWMGQEGTNGLFYAANETGAILSMLNMFMYLYFIQKPVTAYSFVCVLVSTYVNAYLGTKAPFYAFVISAMFLFIYFVFNNVIMENYEKSKARNIFKKGLIILLVAIIVFPTSPFANNYYGLRNKMKLIKTKETKKKSKDKKFDPESSLKSRKFFKEMASKKFEKQSLKTKLLGMGTYEIDPKEIRENKEYKEISKELILQKSVEIDYYDVFYSTGYIGLILTIAPIISILGCAIIKTFMNFKENIKDIDKISQLFIVFLVIGVSFIAGHAFVAPAVSVLIAVILANLVYDFNMIKK